MALRGLYAITDSQLLGAGRLLPYVEAALRGGACLLQYRDKSTDRARRLREAQALAECCESYGAQLIINDDLELACHLGVGLHLGQGDGCLATARARLAPEALLGSTCHASLVLAEQAAREGASYLAFGRFFHSHTKPGAPSADMQLLQDAACFGLPRVAIGGITLDKGASLIDQGADLLAVVHGLFAADQAEEVERRARAFCQLFANR